MTLLNNRAHTPGASMVAEYRCLRCPVGTWRTGGQATLGRHLARTHGLDTMFPSVIHVRDGHVVDWEGNLVTERVGKVNRRVRAYTEGLDAWMRSSPAKVRAT